MNEFFVFIIVVTGIGTSTGVIMEWLKHRTELAKMKIEAQNKGDANVRAAIDELRAEMRALKDTTMQYDLSFDTALQRMEHRVEGLERRIQTGEANSTLDLRSGR